MTATDEIETLRAALHAGRSEWVLAAARRLLADAPDSVDLLEVAALAAERAGDPGLAERHLRHLVAVDPDARWARDDLAHLLLRRGQADAAEAVAKAGLVHDADDPAAHGFLGQLLVQRGRLHEGAWHLRMARRSLSSREAAALAPALARAMLRIGHLDEAATLATEASGSFQAAILAVEVAEQRGDADAAETAFVQVQRLANGRDVTLLAARVLAIGARWREALATLDRLPDEAAGAALLLRGRLRERAGRYAEAWRDFVAGKARLGRVYDRAAMDEHFATQRQWPAGLPAATARGDVPQPIFIMGMPRSGTTLVEQILSAHPDIRAGGELPFVAELRAFAGTLLGGDAPLAQTIARLRIADRHHLPAIFRDFYLARAAVHGRGEGARFFTDKMPLNEVDLPLIRLAFPTAPLILMRRHPLDVLVSMMAHDMTHGGNCAYRIEDAAHHLAGVSALVAHYREHLSIAPLVVRYENLVADPARERARAMAAIGLAEHPAQADFHRQPRHAPTPSHAQVREPVHDRSVARWRRYTAELAPIMPVIAEAIRRDGYTV
ncbi:tetratricopeptide repeat-containing sulfotransferase family protein [Sphingomonas phyllosphaerae]|uniref:tetratricopeptide repeat-containing sulfotransferase family protein n=1 Tax=Sphingomonas phyllosphaerae TaxID=257003 RepID=UPI00068711D5|nr:sulfotransferase [Sphingomonas phyllosphaerae]